MPPKGRGSKRAPVVKEEPQETTFHVVSAPFGEPVDIGDDKDLPPIDVHEYECKMTSNIRKIIAAEAQFNKTMGLLKEAKLESLRKKRLEVLEGTAEEFLERAKYVDEERDRKAAVLKKWFDLHVDRCKRKLEAAEHYSMSSQMDNLINVQERLVEKLREQERKELEALRSAKLVAGQMIYEVENNRGKTMKDVEEWEREPNYHKLNCYRRLLEYPIVVYNLKKTDIQKDLAFCERAILEAEVRETLSDEKNLNGLADGDPEARMKMGLFWEPIEVTKRWREEMEAWEMKNKKKLERKTTVVKEQITKKRLSTEKMEVDQQIKEQAPKKLSKEKAIKKVETTVIQKKTMVKKTKKKATKAAEQKKLQKAAKPTFTEADLAHLPPYLADVIKVSKKKMKPKKLIITTSKGWNALKRIRALRRTRKAYRLKLKAVRRKKLAVAREKLLKKRKLKEEKKAQPVKSVKK